MKRPHAYGEINKNKLNKLSGDINELLPDSRTSKPTSKADPKMEALGKFDGTKVTGR